MASTAHSFIYCLIYSRTRAYQTRPAVKLVSSEEGLSLSRPLLARHSLRVQGLATSRNPESLQGSWFPASLTGKTFEDQDLGWHIADNGAALSVLSRQIL